MFAFSGSVQAAAQGDSSEHGAWSHELTPYLWASRMKGDIETARLSETSVDMKFSDILENLDFGFMTAFQARRGRWGFLFDGIYMKVSDSATAGNPALTVNADIDPSKPCWLARSPIVPWKGTSRWM